MIPRTAGAAGPRATEASILLLTSVILSSEQLIFVSLGSAFSLGLPT